MKQDIKVSNKVVIEWMNEWMRHLYSALLCIVVHPKRFTIIWGGLSSKIGFIHHKSLIGSRKMFITNKNTGRWLEESVWKVISQVEKVITFWLKINLKNVFAHLLPTKIVAWHTLLYCNWCIFYLLVLDQKRERETEMEDFHGALTAIMH